MYVCAYTYAYAYAYAHKYTFTFMYAYTDSKTHTHSHTYSLYVMGVRLIMVWCSPVVCQRAGTTGMLPAGTTH